VKPDNVDNSAIFASVNTLPIFVRGPLWLLPMLLYVSNELGESTSIDEYIDEERARYRLDKFETIEVRKSSMHRITFGMMRSAFSLSPRVSNVKTTITTTTWRMSNDEEKENKKAKTQYMKMWERKRATKQRKQWIIKNEKRRVTEEICMSLKIRSDFSIGSFRKILLSYVQQDSVPCCSWRQSKHEEKNMPA
jgi:hypothetical protein